MSNEETHEFDVEEFAEDVVDASDELDDIAKMTCVPANLQMAKLFRQAAEHLLMLRRSTGGHMKLSHALASMLNTLPPGARKAGPPVFEFTASDPETGAAMPVALDMKFVNPEHVSHVLVPMVNAFSHQMQTELSALRKVLKQMHEHLNQPPQV